MILTITGWNFFFVAGFENLYRELESVFDIEQPSLLHGDLWNGNFMCDQNSEPVLIDPALYFGHRSMDLAMTALFGGFEKSFYEAYNYHFPFPNNYREQWEICNLYPLLIHLNLFGAGYLGQIGRTLERFQ
jgi:protein-ribulosamine 3-kinase